MAISVPLYWRDPDSEGATTAGQPNSPIVARNRAQTAQTADFPEVIGE